MTDAWENTVTVPPFLTSAQDGGEWSASRPCRFTPRRNHPGTHWIEDWMVARADLEAMEWRKITSHCRESKPDRPSLYALLFALFVH
jgi:hypothetical protein